MKDIGEKLRIKREENGLSIDEVANDLKLRPNQINDIELGEKDSFRDVSEIKDIIEEYSKYLGIDSDKLIDEFNEYMFDCTSRIPIDVIQSALNNKDDSSTVDSKKVSSPYTVRNNKSRFYRFVFGCVFVIVLVFVVCLILR